MTEAQRIADGLVEAGILFVPKPKSYADNWPYGGQGGWFQNAEKAISDWRVAGGCLKAMPPMMTWKMNVFELDVILRDPAAICKAFVEAKDD